MINTAEEFLCAANRCGFESLLKERHDVLIIPEFVNRAFACELYLKAIALTTKGEIPKEHKLDKLFMFLEKSVRTTIYNIWRDNAGENIVDCDYAKKKMFWDNLEAVRDIFTRFRYVHEWAGSVVSLEASFTMDQWHLHDCNPDRPLGSPPVHEGFLVQFVNSLKSFIEQSKENK